MKTVKVLVEVLAIVDTNEQFPAFSICANLESSLNKTQFPDFCVWGETIEDATSLNLDLTGDIKES